MAGGGAVLLGRSGREERLLRGQREDARLELLLEDGKLLGQGLPRRHAAVIQLCLCLLGALACSLERRAAARRAEALDGPLRGAEQALEGHRSDHRCFLFSDFS